MNLTASITTVLEYAGWIVWRCCEAQHRHSRRRSKSTIGKLSISATKMEQTEVHAIDFDKSVPENEKQQASNLLSVILGFCASLCFSHFAVGLLTALPTGFHSVIIGLTLAVASNSEFNTL